MLHLFGTSITKSGSSGIRVVVDAQRRSQCATSLPLFLTRASIAQQGFRPWRAAFGYAAVSLSTPPARRRAWDPTLLPSHPRCRPLPVRDHDALLCVIPWKDSSPPRQGAHSSGLAGKLTRPPYATTLPQAARKAENGAKTRTVKPSHFLKVGIVSPHSFASPEFGISAAGPFGVAGNPTATIAWFPPPSLTVPF